MKLLYPLLIALALAACSTALPSCVPPPAEENVVYVIGQGWHVEIGLPVEELSEDLAFYRELFPGARVIMFGYGKKTFFTAPTETLSEYFLGPVPGPAVIQVVGLSVTPQEAYPNNTITLTLPEGGASALSAYIWKDMTKDEKGKPMVVAHSTNPDGLFYTAESEYNLLHTCNAWAADALHEADLPISSNNVIFSNQVMARVSETAEAQCPSLR